ncbi:MAG TPA: VOC family protein, partial [Novosphingobium sp.]
MSRVTEIRYVGYGVADLAAEQAYYGDVFGLEPVASDDGMAWFKAVGSDEHHVVRLRAADANRLDVIALATASRADVDALCEKVRAAGARIIHEPRELTTPGGGYGFRFFSPDGLQIEISADVARGSKRDLARWEGVPVKISHIVLHSPD